MKYDDASWHYEGDFPKDSPNEYGGVHIALFMKWCFNKGWASAMHTTEFKDEFDSLMEGRTTATEYFFDHCDGKLSDEDLSQEGNMFAEQYYGEDGLYFEDVAELFEDILYEAPEEKYDYEKLALKIDKRMKSGIITKEQQKKRKWRFWQK